MPRMPKIKNVNHEEHEERLARKRTEKSEDRSLYIADFRLRNADCKNLATWNAQPATCNLLLHHSCTPKLHVLLTSNIIVNP
jgi:hypothetical protein